MSHDADDAPIDPQRLAILRCPVTRSTLRQEGSELVADVGGLRYPIRGGIAMLLADEARLPEGVATLDEFKAKFRDAIPS